MPDHLTDANRMMTGAGPRVPPEVDEEEVPMYQLWNNAFDKLAEFPSCDSQILRTKKCELLREILRELQERSQER